MNAVDNMIEMAKAAYIQVYGFEKWNSLTDQQKHDAVMILWRDFEKAYDAMCARQ